MKNPRTLFLGSKITTSTHPGFNTGVYLGARSGPFKLVGTHSKVLGFDLRLLVGTNPEDVPLKIGTFTGKRLPKLVRAAEELANQFARACAKSTRKRAA